MKLSPRQWPTLAEQRAATQVGRADCFIHILLGNVQYDGLGYRSPPYHEPLPQPRPKPKPRPQPVLPPPVPLPPTRVLLVQVVPVYANSETVMCCGGCGTPVVWFVVPGAVSSWYPFDVFPFVATEQRYPWPLVGYRDISTLHQLTCAHELVFKRRTDAMPKLRSGLSTAAKDVLCMKNGTAYFMIYQAVQTRVGLLHGKLNNGQGDYCAIGSYFLINAKTALPDDLIDEVAAVNDSMPTLSPRQRKVRMLQWLRWKLTQLGVHESRLVKAPGKKPIEKMQAAG